MKKALPILALSMALILAGCGDGNTSKNSSGSTNVTSSAPVSSSSSAPKVAPTFADADFGGLLGRYYAKGVSLEAKANAFTLSDGTSLIPTAISSNSYGKMITFGSDFNTANYRLSLQGESKSLLNFVLEKEVSGAYQKVYSFMPSVASLRGLYTYENEVYSNSRSLFLTDSFNLEKGHFDAVEAFSSAQIPFQYSFTSFLAKIPTGFVPGIKLANSIGEIDGTFVSSVDSANGLITLQDTGDGFGDMYSNAGLFTFTYFDEASGSETYLADGEAKTFSINDEGAYPYTTGVDENGAFLSATINDKKIRYQASLYGMDKTVDGTTASMVFDTTKALKGEFVYHSMSYSFDGTTLKINGTETPFKYVVKDHRKAISATINGQAAYFLPEKQNTAVKAYLGDETVYFFDLATFEDAFTNSFRSMVNGTETVLTIADDLTLTYGEKTATGVLTYDPTLGAPYFEFTLEGVSYRYESLDTTSKAFVLTKGGDAKTKTYFFEQDILDSLENSFTSKFETEVVLNAAQLTYFGKVYSYTILPDNGMIAFAFKVGTDNKVLEFTLEGGLVEYNLNLSTGEMTSIRSFIKKSIFDQMVGSYYFYGKYGDEKFKLTADGHFYADTINDTKDGLMKEVEYPYILGMYGTKPVLAYTYKSVSIYLYYSEGMMTVFNIPYLVDYLYTYRGVYADLSAGHALELKADGTVYLDGVSATISAVSKDGDKSDISFLVNGKAYTIEFETVSSKKQVTVHEGTASYVLADQSIDFADWYGVYTGTLDSATTTLTLAKTADPITGIDRNVLSDQNKMTYTFTFTVYQGKLALTANGIGVTYYIYNNGTEKVLTIVSSLPPVPPAPIR